MDFHLANVEDTNSATKNTGQTTFRKFLSVLLNKDAEFPRNGTGYKMFMSEICNICLRM